MTKNNWMAVAIVAMLAAGVSGYLYFDQSSKLKKAGITVPKK